ncbi:Eco57I restriction-modification methylase domain-containing protein [Flagellimonas sp. W118]|uniref:Eco57I restriction-modification methylase domain-containing protein n=1 Tax=Flagellimonas sp. W118 TaxID=3410791 RepID=UPI003BF4CDF2
MDEKKKTGSYYTPKTLSDFLCKHIIQKYLGTENISVLEPSCGDGQFVKSFFHNFYTEENYKVEIDLLDINEIELTKAIKYVPQSENLNFYCQDYLEFYLEKNRTYSLIVGNPPYIKKENLEKEQIEICEKVHHKAKEFSRKINSNHSIKNIWTAFVEAAIMSLNDDGIMCFVIPSEILQVKYAEELRAAIADEFERVEVFAFNELIFQGVQQDVVAVIGVKHVANKMEHGFSFYQVNALEDLKEPRFTEKHSNIHRLTLDKWTNYILSDEELNFIDESANNFHSISHYTGKAQVGIVTAANDYFILSDTEVRNNSIHRLKDIIKPIVPKGELIPSTISFTEEDFYSLKSEDKRVNFLHFPNEPKKKFGKIANNYFAKGEEDKKDGKGKLHERFKMTKRENWYHVPSVWASEGLFIKRSHLYPKMFVNEGNAYATDSFYRIVTKANYSIRKLVFSFYNSLTFVLAELEGRFYGGGVLELTPSEFRKLSVPYKDSITDEQFNKLDSLFRQNTRIEEVLAYTNSILIPDIDTIKLERLRKKLVDRRTKTIDSTVQDSIKEDVKTIVHNNNEVAV